MTVLFPLKKNLTIIFNSTICTLEFSGLNLCRHPVNLFWLNFYTAPSTVASYQISINLASHKQISEQFFRYIMMRVRCFWWDDDDIQIQSIQRNKSRQNWKKNEPPINDISNHLPMIFCLTPQTHGISNPYPPAWWKIF
jgi:hypothetical protein